jgi:RNA polymerase sigma factor (sigma-70 family)
VAQRFWGVYQSLMDKTRMPEDELDEFIEHVRFEVQHKVNFYGSTELQQDIHLLENLVQESFAEICESLHNFNPEQNTFKNWVDGLVMNVVKEYFRNKKRKQSLDISLEAKGETTGEIDAEDEALVTKYFSPEETLFKKEKMRYYRKSLIKLQKENPKYYQMIYLRCFQNLTPAETAEFVGCSKEDVYRWLNRALDKISDLITQLEENHVKNKR